MELLDLVVWINFLNYFEWTNSSMCTPIAIYWQGSSTLLAQFVWDNWSSSLTNLFPSSPLFIPFPNPVVQVLWSTFQNRVVQVPHLVFIHVPKSNLRSSIFPPTCHPLFKTLSLRVSQTLYHPRFQTGSQICHSSMFPSLLVRWAHGKTSGF